MPNADEKHNFSSFKRENFLKDFLLQTCLFNTVLFLSIAFSQTQGMRTDRSQAISLDSIPIAFTISPQLMSFANHVLRSSDQVLIPVSQRYLASLIPLAKKSISNPSLGAAINWPDSMFNQINVFGYDFEHWPYTPDSEQANPVSSSQRALSFVRQHGLLYNLGPDLEYASTVGPQMAIYADGFALQLQKLQHNPQLFTDTLKALASRIRHINPKIKIWAQIGAQVSGVTRNLQEMLIAADSARFYADGIDIFYGTAVDTLMQFISKLRGTSTAIHTIETNVPERIELLQNYPNPFNPSTSFSFSLPSKSIVTLKVFTLLGKEVATIVSEELSAGNYSRLWNAEYLSSGTYVYRLSVEQNNSLYGQSALFTKTMKLVLLR